MSDWIQITPARLDDVLTPAELELLRRLSPDAFDTTVGRRITSVTDQIRSRVASRTGNLLSEDTDLIPPELEGQALILIAAALRSSPSLAMPLSEDQRREVADARKDLDAVAAGTFRISAPTTAEAAVSHIATTGSAELIESPDRNFGRTDNRGL